MRAPSVTRLTIAALAASLLTAQTYTISTFAGGALPVNIQGPGASLYGPQSALALDQTGNLFFADGNTVLRLDAVTGVITLVAGNGTSGYSGDNGPAVSAQLHDPYGIAIDAAGNIYIASFFDNVIREISGGVITTVAGTGTPGFSGDNGPASAAQLNEPYGIAVDTSGNLYIADYGNNRIREVSGGVITTVAGNGIAGFAGDNGPAIAAQLNTPHGLAVDASGKLYIADCGNNRIREVSAGVIGTVAGNGVTGFGGDNGPAIAASLDVPSGLALDSSGNLFIADYYNNRVRRVSGGVITTVAGKGTQGFSGDNGPALAAQLNDPFVLAVDSAGSLYIADYGNNRIRKVSAGTIATVAGNGTAGFSGDNGSASGAQLHAPYGVALDSAGDLFIADYQNNRIREVSAGVIITVAGNGVSGFSGDAGPATSAELSQPSAVALDSSGNLYIADFGNNRIRKVSGGTIATVAGNGTSGFSGDTGPAISAQLNQPSGVALDSSGNLYIADSGNNRIRKVSGTTITTVAGNGTAGFSGDAGSPTSAQLHSPTAVALDSSNNLYVADSGNNRIRKVAGGIITTVAGNGTAGSGGDNSSATSAQLYAPAGIALSSGGTLYIADTFNNSIRRVAGGVISTIAGGGASFGDNGPATSTDLGAPQGLAPDTLGNIYIADTLDNRIRVLAPVPLSIAGPTSLPDGTEGTAYGSLTFSASGGAGGYTWSATGLPAGFTITKAGVLSGTPTVAGSFNPQFSVKDSALNNANETISFTIDVPIPAIASVSPASATAHGAAFTLTVNGTGFLASATVQWNGLPLTTKVVNATQLTASVTATLISNAGTATIAVNSGGTLSGTFMFTINPPTPALTSISPTSATATGDAFTLTATGTGFVQATQIEWNGATLQTSFVSATQLTASVPSALIASTGTASVVTNSGGASSAALTFTVNAPPSITGLKPASVTAYGPAFTLTVTGTGFVTGAAIEWNNSPLTTKVVSGTQLTASVPAGTIAGAGSASIMVTSGGVSSPVFTMPVDPPPPVITTLLPASAIATGAAFTLTVNGTGFAQSATVQWNGASLPTTFVSASQLTAYVSATMIATAGTASILVSSGSTSSAAIKFPIGAPPAITKLSPATVVSGGAAFTLTATGTGFVSGTQLQWNGTGITTTFVSATQLTAQITASMIAATGSVTILSSYGGASSNGIMFPINGPPAISSLSPSAAAAGGAAFTLTVNGSGFVSGAAVSWNGTALATKFVSATQLTAQVSASLIASIGSVSVVVNAGGASSSPVALPVNQPPAIASLSPGTIPGTGAAFTLGVNGTGFLSGAIVQWNGTSLTTAYVSSSQLSASVPANLAAGAGTASIVAVNPGGISSVAAKISITAVPPAVTEGGVVPIYSSISVVQPGSWISIYGSGLANGTYTWKGDFPTTLGGTTVKIDNKLAYLWSVSPTQINLQAPADTTTGTVNVVVTTASGSSTSTVTLAPYGPSFSLLPASSYAAIVILTPDGSGAYGGGSYDLAGPAGAFSFNTRPVRSGDTIELFGVGFGPTNPIVPAGKPYTGAAPVTSQVTVTIGGANTRVLFAGITEAGLYQINVVVPVISTGDQTLSASVGGAQTPQNVLVTVQ